MATQTTVSNVRVAHIRPKYKNLQEWMQNDNNVYIARGRIVFIDGERFPKFDSIWANPFKRNKKDKDKNNDIIADYESYIRNKIEKDENMKNQLLKLKGKNLGCWCKPGACHGDILVKLIEEYSKK